jgi:hypothetical protein
VQQKTKKIGEKVQHPKGHYPYYKDSNKKGYRSEKTKK